LKKLGLIILLLFSFQLFGEGYEVKKSKNVTLSEQQISQENKEIELGVENVVRKTYTEYLLAIFDFMNFNIEREKMEKSEKEDLKKMSEIMEKSYTKIFDIMLKNMEIKIKRIEYLSNSKVNVEYDIKTIYVDEKKISKKDIAELEKKFLKKYGYKTSEKQLNNSKEISKLMDIYMERLVEKFEEAEKLKKYEITTIYKEMDKIEGKWISEELNESLKIVKEAVKGE